MPQGRELLDQLQEPDRSGGRRFRGDVRLGRQRVGLGAGLFQPLPEPVERRLIVQGRFIAAPPGKAAVGWEAAPSAARRQSRENAGHPLAFVQVEQLRFQPHGRIAQLFVGAVDFREAVARPVGRVLADELQVTAAARPPRSRPARGPELRKDRSPLSQRSGFRVQGGGVNLCRVRGTHHNGSCMVRFTHPTDCSCADAEAKGSQPLRCQGSGVTSAAAAGRL